MDLINFLRNPESRPPKDLDDKILNFVKRDLLPNHKVIFGKLFLIQAFVGAIVLLFCPQFNFSLTGNYELFHFFHRNFGMYACTAICGGIFLGSGLFFATFILGRGELAAINKSKILYPMALSGLFILIFLFLGAKMYLDISLAWFFGSSLLAIISFEFGNFLKGLGQSWSR